MVPPTKATNGGASQQAALRTSASLFRDEALDHARSARLDGEVLRLSPAWARRTYQVLLASVAASILYSLLGTTYQYASGPAFVRIEGRRELTARAAGIVADVYARPGERVHRGDVLVQFHFEQEQADLERLKREFDTQLVQILRNPADQTAREAAATLEAQRDLAERKLAERTVVAPEDGVVGDVRIHPGQATSPGDPLLILAGDQSRADLIAIIPAQYRPMMHPGMSLRLELTGFKYMYRDLVVDSIGDVAIGQNEVRRYLGPDLADTVSVEGPAVLVHARLPSTTFEAHGQQFQFYDGMPARVDIRVRAERVILTLIPALRFAFGSSHE